MTASTMSTTTERRYGFATWAFAYAVVVGTGLFIAAFASRQVSAPYLGLSLAVLAALVAGWAVFPRGSLYAMLALTVVSDGPTIAWFPFVKNLSSRESIAFVSDALTLSPLDFALMSGVAISLLRRHARFGDLIAPNPVTRPVVIFSFFVLYGFLRGLTSGGDLRVAVLVGRPLFYILMVFVICVNELHEPKHRRYAFAAVLAGVIVQGLLSIEYLNRLSLAERSSLDALNEHGASIGHALLFLTVAVLFLFSVRKTSWRLVLVLGALPVGFVFLVGQRRAGIAAIIVAGIAIAAMLFWKLPIRFWVIVPAAMVLIAGYTLAFWNSTSPAAFPAQAVKAVIAPSSASEADVSSDLYRDIEAFDLHVTIRSSPIAGFGFGQPFLRPIELPDISVFEFNAYQPHNSILWIWIKMGFFGFVSMFYLFARVITVGLDRARRLPNDIDFVVVMCSTLYVIMFAVYSYVDISWDARNSVLLGFATAVCTAGAGRANDERAAQPSAASDSSSTTRASVSA